MISNMAERKGLEPSASGVTGQRYNQLNYRSLYMEKYTNDIKYGGTEGT